MAVTTSIEAELRLHPEVKWLEEEWSGVTDPVLRRKLQNRLNKRAARRRQAETVRDDSSEVLDSQRACGLEQIETVKDLVYLVNERIQASRRRLQPTAGIVTHSGPTPSSREACSNQHSTTTLIEYRKSRIGRLHSKIMLEKEASRAYALPADHLLSLVYYNVYRALVANVGILGLSIDMMATEDYPSPFTPCSPTASSALARLPPSLQPTKLQQTVAHHAQWDLIPDPISRDNILRRGQDEIDDVDLCLDLIGTESRRRKQASKRSDPGCIVWGDPWVGTNWEVTETFVRSYPWMFINAFMLECSTNAWRRSRDDEPLHFASLGVVHSGLGYCTSSESSVRDSSSPADSY